MDGLYHSIIIWRRGPRRGLLISSHRKSNVSPKNKSHHKHWGYGIKQGRCSEHSERQNVAIKDFKRTWLQNTPWISLDWKRSDYDKTFDSDRQYKIVYQDGQSSHTIPDKYKQGFGKSYGRITLYCTFFSLFNLHEEQATNQQVVFHLEKATANK